MGVVTGAGGGGGHTVSRIGNDGKGWRRDGGGAHTQAVSSLNLWPLPSRPQLGVSPSCPSSPPAPSPGSGALLFQHGWAPGAPRAQVWGGCGVQNWVAGGGPCVSFTL